MQGPGPTVVDAGGARKVVSILFADLAGSTALHERLDPESARRVMESYYALARAAVEGNGGTVAKLLGDGILAVFGIPRVAEDDAIRAVRAGIAMQEAFRALAAQQRGAVGETGLRVAVNTGEVVVKGDEIIGDPVNVAARLQERGRNGDVVIGEATRRLVAADISLESLGSLDLKGRAEAVKAYRVLSLDAPGPAAATAFVGREEELARISAVYARAVETPAARLAVLLGSPGLGKSRLIDEFTRSCGETATIVTAQCDAAGGATFAPIAEALRELLGREDRTDPSDPSDPDDQARALRSTLEAALPTFDAERDRIAAGIAALLAGSPGTPEETFFVVRRFLAGLARTRPVVLVIDDLQWAEPLLLDLVEHLVQWGRDLPLLVLIGARPELREIRSSFAMPGGLVTDVVALGALDANVAMRLAAGVIGATDLPAAVAAKVLATSEGNPLFIGELVRMLVDEGALVRDGNRWKTGETLATVEIPPTIHALLAARIERLEPQQCAVLERAAVVGRQFSRSAVAALLPGDGSGLDAQLEALQRAQLIERDTGWLLGEPVLRFHHLLIRDAAYRRLLKGARAEFHERLANWIETRVGDAPEHDETIGRHLEEAHRLLSELGPVDEAGQHLGERAATRLAAAGRRALEGDDVQLAAGLLGRALQRLQPTAEARADLALDCCEALLSAGDVDPAAQAIAELGRCAGAASSDPQLSRLRAWHACFSGHLAVMTAPQELQAAVEAVAAAAAEFSRLDDGAGEAKAHFVHALALGRLGKVGACEAALDQALAAARRAGDRRRANTVLAIAPLAALWGPSPVTRASGRCLDVVRVLRITQGAPAVEAVALSCQGVLEALRGRTEAAHRMIASGREMVEELGIAQRLFETDVFAGYVAMLEGDVAAAERTLRSAYDGLRELGLGIDAARAAALLARALLARNRIDEAEALSHESETLAGDDLKAAIAWRGVRAEALARRGEHTQAIDLARAAVAIAATTDALLDHADARLALAVALRAAGLSAEADAEHRQAIDLWEAKGATLLAESARRRAFLTAPPVAAAAPRVAHASRRRPVRSNFAIQEARRAEAAVAARDVQALESLYRRDVEIVDHQFGIEYGHDAIFERVRLTIHESTDGAFRHEDLATLGDFVALCRLHSTASGSVVNDVPFGATEVTYLLVIEADEQGCARRIDIFGEDKLRDAVARLYERHAALLPEGAARTRAAATAQSMALLRSANADLERLAPALAPEIEGIDHRHLSNWSVRGAAAYLDHLRALHQVADDVDLRWADVLALAPDALLLRVVHRGTERVGGGAYERAFLALWTVGADGRFTRVEWFDEDREAEALARFDALLEGWTPSASRRLVRPNAASASTSRFQAALTTRNLVAVRALIPDGYHEIDHSTGTEWGREGGIASIERLFRSHDPLYELEALATLGERLALNRRHTRASGDRRGRYDVGPYEHVAIQLAESDTRGLVERQETFADHRLGDAIARLYKRHADLSPEGPARDQAAATARTIAALLGPADLDAWWGCLAAGVEFDDHRILGFGSLQGREAARPLLESIFEMSESLSSRIDNVLALGPSGFLVHWTESGVAPGGGDFERVQLTLWILDGEGFVARVEYFDVDREADAIARFEALTRAPSPPARRRVRANAATRSFDRSRAAIDARDADAFAELFDESLTVVHHPTRATYGRRGMLATWRSTLRAERLEFRQEILASLGDTLALDRHVVTVEGLAEAHLAGFGASVFDQLWMLEVDEHGRWIRTEIFAPDRVGDAMVRLYECYAEQQSEDAGRERAAGIARSLAAFDGPIDLDRLALTYDPAARIRDHRILATWASESAAEILQHFRLQLDLASDFAARYDELLALAPDAFVARMTFFGTARDSGGAFENRICVLFTFGVDGRLADTEVFEPESEGAALARFDALAGGPREGDARPSPADRGFSNSATRLNERFARAWAERDWDTVSGAYVAGHHVDDRRRLMQMRLPDGDARAALRFLFDVPGSRWVVTPLATRGEHLALSRYLFEGAVAKDGGPLAIDYVAIDETNADGRFIETVLFDPDDLDAAYAELDRRYGAGDGRHDDTWQQTHRLTAALPHGDVDACRAMLAPGFRVRDHRKLSWGDTLRDADRFLQAQLALTQLSPDWRYRIDHHRARGRVQLGQQAQVGTREGGAFENPFLVVSVLDQQGLTLGFDIYDVDQLEQARARFEELGDAKGSDAAFDRLAELDIPIPPNAAFRAWGRWYELVEVGDWDALPGLYAASYEIQERRRFVQQTSDLAGLMTTARYLREQGLRPVRTLLATAGDRLALQRNVWTAGQGNARSEIETLTLTELDSDGKFARTVDFDPEDRAAASRELLERYIATGTDGMPHGSFETMRGWNEHDLVRVRGGLSEDFVLDDHRLAGMGRIEGPDAYIESVIALFKLIPDARTEFLYFVAIESHGRVSVNRTWGLNSEGGEVESVFVLLSRFRDGKVSYFEMFELEHLDVALARLADRRAARKI